MAGGGDEHARACGKVVATAAVMGREPGGGWLEIWREAAGSGRRGAGEEIRVWAFGASMSLSITIWIWVV